jgi:hypothetical protein
MHYGIAPMAVNRDGTITIWDLTLRRPPMGRQILHEMDRVHPGGIAKLQYKPQEPCWFQRYVVESIMMHILTTDHWRESYGNERGHTLSTQ